MENCLQISAPVPPKSPPTPPKEGRNKWDNDLKTKAKKAREFILNGDRVKISVKFRGRERSRTDLGNEILDKFFAMVEDVAKVSKAATLQNDRFLDMYI